MYGSKWIRIGAITGGLGVSIGALGAHAVETSLQKKTAGGEITNESMIKILENWSTATDYMMYHSVAIVLVGLVAIHICSRLLTYAGSFFTAGIAGFSLGLLLYNTLWITSGMKAIFLVGLPNLLLFPHENKMHALLPPLGRLGYLATKEGVRAELLQ